MRGVRDEMRVIDAHAHTWTRDIISEKDLEARRIAAKRDGSTPQLDSPASSLKLAMEEAAIERAIILPIDSGLNQEMPFTLTEKTDWHVDEIADDASLFTFVGIDPRRGEDGVVELERAVTEKGCIGWKMYPPNGFYPDEDEFYPLYEKAIDLGIPVLLHQGFTSRYKHVKYARPVFVDKVAADFPKLKIVLAHVGYPWVDETLMVAAKNPNVSVDISGWQMIVRRSPLKFYQMIVDAKAFRVFPNRMLWGSDFPLFEHMLPLAEWVYFFKNLKVPESLLDLGYPQVNQDEIEDVMWKNAARLFFGEKP
ncbi:MAG: amidohydrolase family protein [Candidatus Thorarchaeota archaeon]|jgi:predicted TIM-barrel fold metal-dependent hydrolase